MFNNDLHSDYYTIATFFLSPSLSKLYFSDLITYIGLECFRVLASVSFIRMCLSALSYCPEMCIDLQGMWMMMIKMNLSNTWTD
jgi:hypothetical protein